MPWKNEIIPVGDKIIACYFLVRGFFLFIQFFIVIFKIPYPIQTAVPTPILLVISGILFFSLGWGFWRKQKWALIGLIVLSVCWILGGIYVMTSGDIIFKKNPYSSILRGAIILLYFVSSRIVMYFKRKKQIQNTPKSN